MYLYIIFKSYQKFKEMFRKFSYFYDILKNILYFNYCSKILLNKCK